MYLYFLYLVTVIDVGLGIKAQSIFFVIFSILFGVGYLVLEYLFAGTAHEANDVVDGIYYKRMIIAI